MKENSVIGISGLAANLPARVVPLEELQLRSKPETLRGFGFTGAAIAEDIHGLVLKSARQALNEAGVAPREVGALLYAGALAPSHQRASGAPDGGVLDRFCYSASWLQDELALDSASVCGIAQQGCAGFFTALRQARALLVAEPEISHVLCAGGDSLGGDRGREILYNVVSDAACAAVVSRERTWARWIAYEQISKGYYWDVPALEAELIAAYFPTARMAIQRVLRRANLRPQDIDLVIPTGVNASSWPVLMGLCEIPEERLYRARQRFGHTVAADSALYLLEARRSGALAPGMRVLLFTYGFGSSWCALILEASEGVAS